MCNAVGDQLGLRHVVSRRRKGDPAELPIAAAWPFNVRPENYYGDLWGVISEPDQVEDWLSQILALWGAAAPPNQLEFLERIGATSAKGARGPTGPPNFDATPLHERVKAARLALGWSQRELAEAAGTHQPIVSKLENG